MGSEMCIRDRHPGADAQVKLREGLTLLEEQQEKDKAELKELQDQQARIKSDVEFLINAIDQRGTQIKILEEMFS